MALFRRTPRTRRTVAARLQQLQQEGAPSTQDAAAPARNPVRYAFIAALLLMVLGTLWVLQRRLESPPRSLAAQRLADGTMVRLLAINRAAPHFYQYEPPKDPLRALAERLGLHIGWPTIASSSALASDDGLTIWLQTARPLDVQPEGVEFRADDGAVYRAGEPDSPARRLATVTAGSEAWGRGSLVWVSLGNYDHSARRLTVSVPLGETGAAAQFTIDGPGQPAAAWEMTDSYPLTAGNKDAVVRLHQLRPAQIDAMGVTLDGEPLPEPVEDMLLADIDVSEPLGSAERAAWHITVDDVVTRRGERLAIVRDQAGLVWLSRGRTAEGIDALRLKVTAEKRIRGSGVVVFRNLELPEVGKKVVWSANVDGPFPGSEFVAQTCERTKADQIVVQLDARASGGTEFFTFAYVEGLDQEGRRLRNIPGTTISPDEVRTSEAGNTWRWTFEGKLLPDTKRIALAFRVTFLRIGKRSTATFTAPVQPRLRPQDQAACGLALAPFIKPGESLPRVEVASVTAESSAAESSLRPGDEILQVDGLPPNLWSRAMLRHRPGESLDVLFRRGEEIFRAAVKLDQAGPGEEQPAGDVGPTE